MRVLILNQCFYPDVVATAQHGWDLALHLRKEGHEITAIASRSIYGAKGASLAKREVVQGVRIERVSASIFGKSSILARACDFLFFYILALWRALTLPKHDVCVVFTTPPFISLASWILRLIRGTRYVYWVMDLYPDVPVVCGVMRKDSLATRFFEGVNRFCLRRADRVVVLGRCMESLVLSKGIPASKLVRINVWSDQEEIKPIAREANAYRREWNVGDRLLVMYSGNFGIGHDIETMADGVTQLASDPRILFAFVGGGKRKPELIDILKSRGVTGFIDAPYQPRERLDELLSAADVHLASLKNGAEGVMVPCKLYGVLAASRPVVYVGSPSGEVARVIAEEHCGAVVPCGDSARFIEAILGYANDRASVDADGARGRAALTEKWGASHALAKWSTLLGEIAART